MYGKKLAEITHRFSFPIPARHGTVADRPRKKARLSRNTAREQLRWPTSRRWHRIDRPSESCAGWLAGCCRDGLEFQPKARLRFTTATTMTMARTTGSCFEKITKTLCGWKGFAKKSCAFSGGGGWLGGWFQWVGKLFGKLLRRAKWGGES